MMEYPPIHHFRTVHLQDVLSNGQRHVVIHQPDLYQHQRPVRIHQKVSILIDQQGEQWDQGVGVGRPCLEFRKFIPQQLAIVRRKYPNVDAAKHKAKKNAARLGHNRLHVLTAAFHFRDPVPQ